MVDQCCQKCSAAKNVDKKIPRGQKRGRKNRGKFEKMHFQKIKRKKKQKKTRGRSIEYLNDRGVLRFACSMLLDASQSFKVWV